MNILILMAGDGLRFRLAGYELPKPLISVKGKPMVRVVIESIGIKDANYIYVIRMEHNKDGQLVDLLQTITPKCTIIEINGLTEGAACSALMAKEYINSDSLLIANCDQIVNWQPTNFLDYAKHYDGCLLTCSPKFKYSFAHTSNNLVDEISEKELPHTEATIGIYYWDNGLDFVSCSEEMIKNNIRYNNEFYIAPVYNTAIQRGLSISTYNIDLSDVAFIGCPEDLSEYDKSK